MESTIYDISVSSNKYHNKPINITCTVSGKSISPYNIPEKIQINCLSDASEKCNTCPVFSASNVLTIDYKQALFFVDVSTRSFGLIIKDIYNISCKFNYDIIETQNVERIFILPPMGSERSKVRIAQTAYYIGHGLEVNNNYQMQGFTTVEPATQTVTHVFTKADKLRADYDNYTISPERHKALEAEFSIQNATSDKIFCYLENLYRYYAHNVTKIHNRFDLHLAVDLAFKSVLSFNFDGEYVHKGWADIMVIGDTRTGKGYVTEKLVDYFSIGDIISAENISFAGLIGGLQQYNGHWVITWGKIPLNDGGLVVVDEASELTHSDWTKLSRVRSEGVAEIVKIQSQATSSRTRLIFLSNPKNRAMNTYSYGIQALADVVKTPEDMARFDYVLTVSHTDVSIEEINVHRDEVDKIHSPELENELVLWVWSRRPDEIQFSKEAIKVIYEIAVTISKEYSISIPLIQGENIRIKLAKIAICFAGRVYSNREEGKILYVDIAHVKCSERFLHLIYKKEASGYYAYSKLQSPVESSDSDFEHLDTYFNSYGKNKIELCKCLIRNNTINVKDLSEHINQPPEIVREIIHKLVKGNAVIKRHFGYVKTPAFTNWLKRLILTKEE